MVRLLKSLFCWVLRLLLALVVLFGAASFLGSSVPVNRDWREEPSGIPVYVISNGYHTGLILPTSAGGIDLSLSFRATDLPDPEDAGDYLLFGWGDRDFYLNTPSWRDARPATLFTALWGSGKALLHVDHLRSPAEVPDRRMIYLNRRQYARLARQIIEDVKTDATGQGVAVPGYGSLDVFYEAEGSYNLFRTCNVWTANRLADAGVKVGYWTPFSGGVMWWF
jgi:uncharacterized protein (TIGR02117 family)